MLHVLGWFAESTAYSHPAMFVHALPHFELDSKKWVGSVFGATSSDDTGPVNIPLMGMVITHRDYAVKLSELFLAWTGGALNDTDRSIHISVVVLNKNEYVFLCHPSMRRHVAAAVFDAARADLRQSSLEDVVTEHHVLLLLGKRCYITDHSQFPTFRRMFKPGTPVVFGFFTPNERALNFWPGVPTFVIHDFEIKEKRHLTRKDFEYDAIGGFEVGGEWQGPRPEPGG